MHGLAGLAVAVALTVSSAASAVGIHPMAIASAGGGSAPRQASADSVAVEREGHGVFRLLGIGMSAGGAVMMAAGAHRQDEWGNPDQNTTLIAAGAGVAVLGFLVSWRGWDE